MSNDFHDYLKLKELDFSQTRVVIFYGESGTGKSTYIKNLKKKGDLVIDEVWKLKHLFLIMKKINHQQVVYISSHIPKIYFSPFFLFFKIRFYSLNICSEKIEYELSRRSIGFSKHAISVFINNFGASYNDLNIILKEFPDVDFDIALSLFLKNYKITKNPSREVVTSPCERIV